MIVYHMISWLYFLISSLGFLSMVLHIFAYCIRCLVSQFLAISRRFVIRARDGDDNLELCVLLIDLATLDTLCWIMYVMSHSVDVV